MYEDWSIDKLRWYKDKLQKEFDELYNAHKDPLIYRHIGCRIIYILKLIKEKEDAISKTIETNRS